MAGNAISMFIKNHRWLYYRFFVYAFAAMIFIFPFLAKSFNMTVVLAVIVAVFF